VNFVKTIHCNKWHFVGVIPLGGADEKEWLDGVAILAAVIVIALVSVCFHCDRFFCSFDG
jgi:hypothetical protein